MKSRFFGWLRRHILCWHPCWHGQEVGRLIPYPNRYCCSCGRTERVSEEEVAKIQSQPRCPYKKRTLEELEAAMRTVL